MMPKLNHMVDQHRTRLEPGQNYGVAFGGGSAARVFRLFALLRHPRPLACFIEIDPRTRQPTGVELALSNSECALYFFHRLDSEFREVPTPTQSRRVRELSRFLRELNREAARLRKRQLRLMQEANAALFGCGDPVEIGDAVAAWIRDTDSHVTIEHLIDLFVRSEREPIDYEETL
jgi:hypothetical protein